MLGITGLLFASSKRCLVFWKIPWIKKDLVLAKDAIPLLVITQNFAAHGCPFCCGDDLKTSRACFSPTKAIEKLGLALRMSAKLQPTIFPQNGFLRN